MAAVVLLLAVPIAWAVDGDGIDRGDGPTLPLTSPAGVDLVDAWNDDQPPTGGSTYGVDCFGFEYTPSLTYLLYRIEWYGGDIAGDVSTKIMSGGFGGTVLGFVAYQETPPRSWQGADFAPPVYLEAGTTYYIVYDGIVGALASIADTGTIIPHWASGDCTNFNGPFPSAPWMARFYGTTSVSVEPGSWGRIKGIYR
jgi:hypothetical protein